MRFTSFSQNGEDVVLWRALKNITNGFYVDVGAYDPVEHSVTKAFYDRGWRGINIEPVEAYFQKFLIERWGDINLNIAISDQAGLMRFHRIPGTGLSTLKGEIAAAHNAHGWKSVDDTVTVLTLNDVLDHANQEHIHFLKIDVEGGELNVLKGLDLNRHRPWVIVVESTQPLTTERSDAPWSYMIQERNYINCFFDGLNIYFVATEQQHLISDLARPANVLDDFVHIDRLKDRFEIPAKLDLIKTMEQETLQLKERMLAVQSKVEETKMEEAVRRTRAEEIAAAAVERREVAEKAFAEEREALLRAASQANKAAEDERELAEKAFAEEREALLRSVFQANKAAEDERELAEKAFAEERELLLRSVSQANEAAAESKRIGEIDLNKCSADKEALAVSIINLKEEIMLKEMEISGREQERFFADIIGLTEKLDNMTIERNEMASELEVQSQKINRLKEIVSSQNNIQYELSIARPRIATMAGYIAAIASGGNPRGWRDIRKNRLIHIFPRSTIRSSLDTVSIDSAAGWVLDKAHPDKMMTVCATFGGEIIATALADQFRPDLHAAGIGSGRHGFHISLPTHETNKARDNEQPILITLSNSAKTLIGVIPFTKINQSEIQHQISYKEEELLVDTSSPQITTVPSFPRAKQILNDLIAK